MSKNNKGNGNGNGNSNFKITVKNVGIIFGVVLVVLMATNWLFGQFDKKADKNELLSLRTDVQTLIRGQERLVANMEILMRDRIK